MTRGDVAAVETGKTGPLCEILHVLHRDGGITYVVATSNANYIGFACMLRPRRRSAHAKGTSSDDSIHHTRSASRSRADEAFHLVANHGSARFVQHSHVT